MHLLLTLVLLHTLPQPARAMQLEGVWRITRGVAAPWAAAERMPLANAGLRGRTVELTAGRVIAPPPLGCGSATYEFVVVPAEGLFQGALGDPEGAAARALGVAHLPVTTLRVSCDAGVFDYHFIATDRMLIALDEVVWTLAGPGRAAGPATVVRMLLAEHLIHETGFTPESVRSKRRFLSPGLDALISAYFAREMPADEPPPINGDPITDSQEPPSGFLLGRAETRGAVARVPVRFRDGARMRGVELSLRRLRGRWLVDDLIYEDGTTFRELLRAP